MKIHIMQYAPLPGSRPSQAEMSQTCASLKYFSG